MGWRTQQIKSAKEVMDVLYRTIESDIYRMYNVPTIPDIKGRKKIDRDLVNEETYNQLMILLNVIQKKVNYEIKKHGLQIYATDFSDDLKTYYIHILEPKGEGRNQEERIRETIFTHTLVQDYVFVYKTKKVYENKLYNETDKKSLRERKKLLRQKIKSQQ
jgi:hypothetical protein